VGQLPRPRLSALIQKVAERNLDLQMASARLLQSRALRSTVAADEAPSVDVNAGYSRARNSAEGLSDPSGKAGKSAFNLWQGDLVAGWELDLWGRVRRQVEAADATVEVAENDRRGVLLALLSETAGNYIQLRAVQHTLDVTQDNLKVARHSLKLSEDRQAEGVATRLDVAQASAQVASIEARLPTLEARRDDLINALSLLAAEPPRSLQASCCRWRAARAAATLCHRLAVRAGRAPPGHPPGRSAPACCHRQHWRGQGRLLPEHPPVGQCRLPGHAVVRFRCLGFATLCLRAATVAADFRGWAAQGTLELREAQQQEAAQLPQGGARRLARDRRRAAPVQRQPAAPRPPGRGGAAEPHRPGDCAAPVRGRGGGLSQCADRAGCLLASEEQWIDSSAAVSQALGGVVQGLGWGWQAFDKV
jgi:hypothetical protein